MTLSNSDLLAQVTIAQKALTVIHNALTPAPVSVSPVPLAYAAISDRVVHSKPALPSLGPAGFAFTDPTFGSRLLRVTDGLTRPGLVNRSFRVLSNAHAAAWNADATMFVVTSTDGALIPYTFDRGRFAAERIPAPPNENGGLTLAFQTEPQFSLTDRNVIYGNGGPNNHSILAYDFRTGAYTTILTIEDVVPGIRVDTYVGLVTTGNPANETLLIFFGGTGQDAHFYALVEPIKGGPSKLLNTMASTINGVATSSPLGFHLHAAQIDKSGRYVFLYPAGADRAAKATIEQVYLWDTSTDVFTPLSASLHPAGHDAAGYGVWINQDCCTSSAWDAAQWQFRSLSAPAKTRDLISPLLTPKEIYLADHTSWSNAQPDRLVPVISATYRFYPAGIVPAEWRPWDDEVVAIETAPSSAATRVWRFCHHRSDVRQDSNPNAQEFWYEPLVNVSPDGRFAIFTSNWEKTLGKDAAENLARQDVFVVELKA